MPPKLPLDTGCGKVFSNCGSDPFHDVGDGASISTLSLCNANFTQVRVVFLAQRELAGRPFGALCAFANEYH